MLISFFTQYIDFWFHFSGSFYKFAKNKKWDQKYWTASLQLRNIMVYFYVIYLQRPKKTE